MRKFVVEWTDASGVYQFRIMGEEYALLYKKYLDNAGLGAHCYAA